MCRTAAARAASRLGFYVLAMGSALVRVGGPAQRAPRSRRGPGRPELAGKSPQAPNVSFRVKPDAVLDAHRPVAGPSNSGRIYSSPESGSSALRVRVSGWITTGGPQAPIGNLRVACSLLGVRSGFSRREVAVGYSGPTRGRCSSLSHGFPRRGGRQAQPSAPDSNTMAVSF